jgi:hypothetical protein
MKQDPLDYQTWIQDSFRSIVRRALALVAEGGLPGEHFFSITFRTDHPEVAIPAALRQQYPEEMPIVLQHQFWNLQVDETAFSVALSFGGAKRNLLIPFASITAFDDPEAKFGLRFQPYSESDDAPPDTETSDSALPPEEDINGKDGTFIDNVVSLDSFRKKE